MYARIEGVLRTVLGVVRPWVFAAGLVLALLALARLLGLSLPSFAQVRGSLTDMAIVSALLIWAGR